MKYHRGLAVAGSRFTWENGVGYGEISDFRDNFHQIWPDACDVGFTVASHRTHAVVTFVETGEKRDREGEVQSRIFTAINARTGRVDTSANALRIELFND
jgi:hypothetical protein